MQTIVYIVMKKWLFKCWVATENTQWMFHGHSEFLMPFLNLMSHLKCEHFIDTGTCFQLSLVKKTVYHPQTSRQNQSRDSRKSILSFITELLWKTGRKLNVWLLHADHITGTKKEKK